MSCDRCGCLAVRCRKVMLRAGSWVHMHSWSVQVWTRVRTHGRARRKSDGAWPRVATRGRTRHGASQGCGVSNGKPMHAGVVVERCKNSLCIGDMLQDMSGTNTSYSGCGQSDADAEPRSRDYYHFHRTSERVPKDSSSLLNTELLACAIGYADAIETKYWPILRAFRFLTYRCAVLCVLWIGRFEFRTTVAAVMLPGNKLRTGLENLPSSKIVCVFLADYRSTCHDGAACHERVRS
jgi:hypothetical protein